MAGYSYPVECYMLEVKYNKTLDLIPYVNNSRTHSDEQITQVAASIKEFGFTNPILLDEDGGIIAGHGRLQAAKKLGMKEVPTITLSNLSEAQKKAYVIADNKLALNAGWDDELLILELNGLREDDFDLTLIGFNVDELAYLINKDDIDIDITEEDYKENQNFLIKCESINEMESLQSLLRSNKPEMSFQAFEQMIAKL